MCGIAGVIAPEHSADAARLVAEVTAAQHQRGPDNTAVEEIRLPGEAAAVLGHNRLSIIDLSPEANQPMWDAEHRYAIIFNGEIYNHVELRDELRHLGHRFATASDTEVILEAFKEWRDGAFGRLNGMFAFAILEPAERRLWLVRDRFGVKPLFIHQAADTIYFASTPLALARGLQLRPDLGYVSRGLHYWLYEDDGTLSQYEGVESVPAGTFIQIQVGASGRTTLVRRRFYDLLARVQARREELVAVGDGDAGEQVLELLTDAVRIRLRADVPVGISLSGGLDSSSIAALMGTMHQDVRGFSYAHPDAPESEGHGVARVVERTGVNPTYIWPGASAGNDAFWETLAAQDAPFPGLSIVAQYLVFNAAHDAGMKVLLGGQGADEILMGYRKFQVMLLADAVKRRDPLAAVHFAWSSALMLTAEASRASTYLRQRRRYLSDAGLETTLRLPPPAPLDLSLSGPEAGWHRQVRDVTRLSLPTLLRYEDRNSMGNSLETRLPFLDYRFVELALGLPDRVRVRSGYGKWILREAMRGRVPASIRTTRAKRGFDAPEAAWIANGLGAAIRDRLSGSASVIAEWLPTSSAISKLYSDQRLAGDPAALAEATSLLWLASKA